MAPEMNPAKAWGIDWRYQNLNYYQVDMGMC